MVDDILLDAEDRMDKTVDALKHDLLTIRTGRASPALVEHIPVSYYGMPTPLQQLAVIGVPEPRLITIKPFSKKFAILSPKLKKRYKGLRGGR